METQDTIFSDITPDETEAGMLLVFFTRVFDFAIDILILLLVYWLLPFDALLYLTSITRVMLPILIIAVSTAYRLIFLLLFNKTIGMMLCRVKLLNKDLQPLSPKGKLISIFKSRFSSIKYYKDTL